MALVYIDTHQHLLYRRKRRGIPVLRQDP